MTTTEASTEPRGRRAQSEAERARIEAAMAQLLARPPARGVAPPSVSELARVAGVKRWVLTHKHTDLKERFQAEIERTWAAPSSADLTEEPPRVQRLLDEIARLRQRNNTLEDLVSFYSNVLQEISIEYEPLAALRKGASNVFPLDTQRQRKERSRSGRDRTAGEQFTPGADGGDEEWS
jgi:AcrR family transcriptional regulator